MDPMAMVRNLPSEDMAALRGYVTAADHLEYTGLADGTVQLDITHQNLKQQVLQQRLDLHMTIGQLKEKLYHHCGTSPCYMQLVLRSASGMGADCVAVMDDETKKLGYYSPQNGMIVHIVDKDPNSLAKTGWLENVNLVEKYMISENDYDKRKNTVRNYKREQLAKDPNWKPKCMMQVPGKENEAAPEIPGADSVEGMKVGDRCEVQPGARRGEVMFVGEAKGEKNLAPGYWVGVKFDEPLGRNDGSVKGVKYFECPPKHGAFVRGKNIAVGDFPEVDPFADLSDSDEDEL